MGNRDVPVADEQKVEAQTPEQKPECACKHCVARKDIPYPGEDFPEFLPVIFAIVCFLSVLTFKTYGSFMSPEGGAPSSFVTFFVSMIFLGLSGVVFFFAARHFVKRRVIGENYFLFLDNKNEYHCHHLYPTERFVVGDEVRCLGGWHYVAQVRNGGWSRSLSLFVGMTRTAPLVTTRRFASWSLAHDLRIIYDDGSVLYDDRDTELPGEFLFRTMEEFSANPKLIINAFREEKQLRASAVESAKRLGNELTEAQAKLREYATLVTEFVLFFNGERLRIKDDPNKLGRSLHAQQLRRNIEEFILLRTPEQLALSHTLRSLMRKIQEEQPQRKASTPLIK